MSFKNLDRVGEKHYTNEGHIIEIIEYSGSFNCTVIFENGLILTNIRYDRIINGEIKNLTHPSVCGVGYVGVGNYKSKNNCIPSKEYSVWRAIIMRCYNLKRQLTAITYKDVTVCSEWHNFQNFAKWYEENYVEGWELDKDIICPNCKIYSPETCCFVPREINLLFKKPKKSKGNYPTGVQNPNSRYSATLNKNYKGKHLGTFDTPEEAFLAYKIAKEKHIKEVANKWKDKIDQRVYEAMYKYEVNIND